MAKVSAEATGLVRSDLQKFINGPEKTVIHRIQDVLERRTSCLQKGRRLSELEVSQLRHEILAQVFYKTDFLGRYIYPQGRKLQIGEEGFLEWTLELRAISLEVKRRRVRYSDYTLGVQFSFHSLARIVERLGLRTSIVGFVVEAGAELSANLLALRLGHGDLTFAVPFCDGLAFGEYVSFDALVPGVDYVSDSYGSGFVDLEAPTLWRQVGGKTIGCRIRTFLGYDQLGTAQEELRTRWDTLRSKHAKLWTMIFEASLIQDGSVLFRSYENDLVELGADIAALVATDVWSRTIRHR